MDIETTSVNPETREATSSVELSGVRQGDSGQYVCRAVNQVGGVEIGSQETQATLVVIGESVCVCVCEYTRVHKCDYTCIFCVCVCAW